MYGGAWTDVHSESSNYWTLIGSSQRLIQDLLESEMRSASGVMDFHKGRTLA